MMIKGKFSIMSAYGVGIKILYENPLFYVGWLLVSVLFDATFFLGASLYLHLIDSTHLLNNFLYSIKDFFSDIYFYNPIQLLRKVDGVSSGTSKSFFYEILSKIFPHNLLNHALENMSLSEYYNVVIYPRIVPTLVIVAIGAFFGMSMMIGYIKTALALQDKRAVSLHDIYRHYYLVPYYLVVSILKIIVA